MKLMRKVLSEMEELKKFQSSTFDTIARRRLVEDQDTILELTGKGALPQDEVARGIQEAAIKMGCNKYHKWLRL